MKKLEFPNYPDLGIDLRQEDLTHMYEAIVDGLTALGESLSEGTGQLCRMAGVDIVQSTVATDQVYTCTGGWMYWEGELYEVLAHSLSIPLGSPNIALWVIVETIPQDEPHILDDNTTAHTLKRVRRMGLVAGPAGGVGVPGYVTSVFNFVQTLNSIRTPLENLPATWQTWNPSHTPVGGGIINVTSINARRKVIGSVVIVNVKLDFTQVTVGTTRIDLSLPVSILIRADFVGRSVYLDDVTPAGAVVADGADPAKLSIRPSGPFVLGAHAIAFQIIYEKA